MLLDTECGEVARSVGITIANVYGGERADPCATCGWAAGSRSDPWRSLHAHPDKALPSYEPGLTGQHRRPDVVLSDPAARGGDQKPGSAEARGVTCWFV
jgi:hypothetical protein